MTKRTRVLMGLAIGVAALFTVLVCVVIDWYTPFDDEPFTRSAWASADALDRAPMAADLVRRHLPQGLADKEIVRLLGPPTHTWRKDDNVGYRVTKGTKTLAYWLGSWSFQAWDDSFVYVHLDGEDRLIEAEINGF